MMMTTKRSAFAKLEGPEGCGGPLRLGRRRGFCKAALACLAWGAAFRIDPAGLLAAGPDDLPLSVRFKGQSQFDAMVAKARKENWRSLPIGERVARFGRELHGVPYVSFTLEIDDRIEAPSVNLQGVDCWSFFEISLGMARMMAQEKDRYAAEDLLRQIQFTRYRGGVCTGNYLQRIHYLAEWYFDNDARGVVDDLTKDLGGALPIRGRKCQEMSVLWKNYRYLRENPELRPRMARLEEKISQLPVYYLPENRVAAIEPKLQNGDILGIVTKHDGGFCSHVGIAYRTGDGVLRLMHASSQRKYRRVVIDKRVSEYLKDFSSSIGILVGRPREVEHTVTDTEIYRKNLVANTGKSALVTDLDP